MKGTKGRLKGLASNKLIVTLSVLLLITIISALSAFLYVSKRETADKGYLSRSGEMNVLGQQIATYALSASQGSKRAFEQLKESRNRFNVIIRELQEGVPNKLPKSPKAAEEDLTEVAKHWLALRNQADEILKGEEAIVVVESNVKAITVSMQQLEKKLKAVVKVMIKRKSKPLQVYFATRQLQLAQRIENNVNKILGGGNIDIKKAIESFEKDSLLFGRVLEGMLEEGGDPAIKVTQVTATDAQQKMRSVAMLFSAIEHNAKQIISTADKLIPALQAAAKITQVSDRVDQSVGTLMNLYQTSPGRMKIGVGGLKVQVGFTAINILGLIATLLLILLGFQLLFESKRRELEVKEMSERNQQAILRLLDEMEYLADGDLTVQITVTEDVTGAIADAINTAIETLRVLVTTINKTSEQVTASAQETRATATHLAQASEHQNVQIQNAGNSIDEMSKSISQVSNDAIVSEDVSQKSLEAAALGASKVRSTIQGMDHIREQIQETSKRIKRLGESSQEIGDIVELIDDISDQTNILALNAAMQAAMAGEAGRGFAVVADEVQRLAERTGAATKQIEALVKTIQADTNEAVRSMETSTSGVVDGAKLAEEAGESLSEIETVSSQIADLTQRISNAAKQQTTAIAKVSETMDVIQEITKQTSEGTSQTEKSIGNLADLADDLQKSVAGFRLPESV